MWEKQKCHISSERLLKFQMSLSVIFMELVWDKESSLENAFTELFSMVHNESHIQYSAFFYFLFIYLFSLGLGYVQYFCTCLCDWILRVHIYSQYRIKEDLQVDWKTELKFRMVLISCKNNQENYRAKLGGTIAKYFSSAEWFSHTSRGRGKWQSSNSVKNLHSICTSQAYPDAAEKKVSEMGN